MAAILIAMPVSSLLSILSLFSQTAIITDSHSRLDLSFIELLFLLWSCRCHVHFVAKDVFVVTTGRCPVFLLFWSPFSSFSRRHAVPIVTVQPVAIHIHVLSSFQACILLSSIVLYPRKNTRTRLPIFYGCVQYEESRAVVQLQYVSGCGKSTI